MAKTGKQAAKKNKSTAAVATTTAAVTAVPAETEEQPSTSRQGLRKRNAQSQDSPEPDANANGTNKEGATTKNGKKDPNKKVRVPDTICFQAGVKSIDSWMRRSMFVTVRDVDADGKTFRHCLVLLVFKDKAWSTWVRSYLPKFARNPTLEIGDIDKFLKRVETPAYNRHKAIPMQKVITDAHKKYQAKANLGVKTMLQIGAVYDGESSLEAWSALLPKDQAPYVPFLSQLLECMWRPPAGISTDIFFTANGGLREKDAALNEFDQIYTSYESITHVVQALLAQTEGGIFSLDEDVQVKIMIFILYVCIAVGDAEPVIGAWLSSPDPQLEDLVSFHNIGFVGFLMGMHLSRPEVVRANQWWNGSTMEPSYVHLTAIKKAIKSAKSAAEDEASMTSLSAKVAEALAWARNDASTNDEQEDLDDGGEDEEDDIM